MQLTAAVINAGLGDLTLGLEMAGFHVIAAYEMDQKAVAIHKRNFDVPVYPITEEGAPSVDLLAARIYQPVSSRVERHATEYERMMERLANYLQNYKPKAFLLHLNLSSIRTERMGRFFDWAYEHDYHLSCRILDVSQLTGFPVNERMACAVGILKTVGKEFLFPETMALPIVPEEFLDWNDSIDPWYYRINFARTPILEDGSRFYSWKGHAYFGTEHIQWNQMRYPIVLDSQGLRRITHREIANLKGFPEGYSINDKNKSWLYEKLMYAGNVVVLRQVAETLRGMLEYDPWRSQQRLNRIRFKRLFTRYLSELTKKAPDTSLEVEQTGEQADFIFGQGNERLYFEVRYYNNDYALHSKVKAACEHMKLLKEGIPVLVIANEAPEQLKEECKEQYGVYIWDVGNLLWMFSDFPNIRNEFVALLSYSVEHIEPCAPVPNIHRKVEEAKQEELDWRGRLKKIEPGREQFAEYEAICIEMLKYVLGDYLTLWEAQQKSNNGLYRFDLCCKIKNGADHDFFDTIKHYFNTKYIVFEFKNYQKEIGQEEIYTTEKYLYEKALRKVAIIISRNGANQHAFQAARGTLRETGKLILCLSDNALLDMVDIKERGEQEPAEYLGTILDDVLMHLEK